MSSFVVVFKLLLRIFKNNTKSTTKLSHIHELADILERHRNERTENKKYN